MSSQIQIREKALATQSKAKQIHDLLSSKKPVFQRKIKPENDPRDDRHLIPTQSLVKLISQSFDQIQRMKLLDWMDTLYTEVINRAFFFIKQNQLTSEEGKNYISKNIIYNIGKLVQNLSKRNLSANLMYEVFEFLDKKAEFVIKKILHRYPESSTSQSPNLKVLMNNFLKQKQKQKGQQQPFLGSSIKFEYRKNEDYITTIMKALNEVMMNFVESNFKIDQTMTNFQAFNMIVQAIFTSAGCEQFQNHFIPQMQNFCRSSNLNSGNLPSVLLPKNKKTKREVQNYRKRIRETQITTISKKIRTPVSFSQQDMDNQRFWIPDAALIRIMESWSRQLQKNIQNIIDSENTKTIKLRNHQKTIQFTNKDQIQCLIRAASEEQCGLKVHFQNFKIIMKENALNLFLESNNKSHQNIEEGPIGYFTSRSTIFIAKYILGFLKKIIHSLLTIPRRAAQLLRQREVSIQLITSVQQLYLITFKVTDLMRARIKSDEDQLANVFELFKVIDNQIPHLMKIVNVKDRTSTKESDFLLQFIFMNKFYFQLELQQIPSDEHKYIKQNMFNSINRFLSILKDSQIGVLGECVRILSQHDPVINYLTLQLKVTPKIQERVFHSKVNLKKQQIQFATLNYSGILYSPFEFYSASYFDYEQKLGKHFKKRLELSNYKQLKWNVGQLDKKIQQKRYAPVYNKEVGIKDNKLITSKQFNIHWDHEFDKEIKNYPSLNYKNEQKECLKVFDRLCYQTFVTFVYPNIDNADNAQSIDKKEQIQGLNAQTYKQFMNKFFERSFVQDHKKINKTLMAIKSQKLDIIFLQETNKYLLDKLNEYSSTYKYRRTPEGSGQSIVLVTSPLSLQKDQTEEMLKKLTTEEVKSLNWNDDTAIMFINKYILLSGHLSSKKEKNPQQRLILGKSLNMLKSKFPDKVIIVGCDGNSPNVTCENFEVFPIKQDHYTTYKQRTPIQLQANKTDILASEKRDYLISSVPLKNTEITTINNQDLKNTKYYVPAEDHPFDHYMVKASIINTA